MQPSQHGLFVSLQEALKYKHLGETLTTCGATLEARAEVGLLTRNVLFRGSISQSFATETIPACPAGFDTGRTTTLSPLSHSILAHSISNSNVSINIITSPLLHWCTSSV